jgi:hypothetical protein
MDRNKLKILNEIGYVVRDSCGSCQYGDIKSGRGFGVCLQFHYLHEKHKTAMLLSIHRSGWCSNYLRKIGDWPLEGFEQLRESNARPDQNREDSVSTEGVLEKQSGSPAGSVGLQPGKRTQP